MPTSLYTRFFRGASCLLLLFALSGCAGLFSQSGHAVKHAKPVKTAYTAADYVKYLSLAQLAPEDSAASIEAINAYALQKPKKPQPQGLLVFDYKTAGDVAMQQAVAPIGFSGKEDDFTEVPAILGALAANRYTLHNLHMATLALKPDKTMALPEAQEDLETALKQRQAGLLENAAPLPPPDNIRAQLRLIAFFTQHRFRDAAYLAADNAKQSLAALPHATPEEAERVRELSQELERLESELRKTLPFGF